MKKVYLFGLIMGLALVGLTSCNDDEDQLTDSRLTNYAVLELQGDEFMPVALGSSFVDPGCKATLGGEDFTANVQAIGASDVDPNTVGFYDITYVATNPDGYQATASRTVCVYDPSVTLDMSGTYNVDMEATLYGKPTGTRVTFANRAAYYGNTTQCTDIEFTKILPGVYACNDLFGHWYNQIRGYGASYGTRYDMTGYVSLDNEGNIELLSSYVQGWGDGLDYIKNGKYDEAAGTVSYFMSYASAIYIDLVMNKQ